MAIGLQADLLLMFDEVARDMGVAVTLTKPDSGARNWTTGVKPDSPTPVGVTAIPGRFGSEPSSYGRAKGHLEQGWYTVKASDVAALGQPTDKWTLALVGDEREYDVEKAMPACAGLFIQVYVNREQVAS